MQANWRANWRLSTFSGAIVASYFVPAWSLAAFRIAAAPVQGLFERPNVAVAMFISDYLQASPLVTVRLAWLLALGKLTLVAFFLLFAALAIRASVRRARGCDEALAIATGVGCVISFISMVFAAQVGEHAALRLHATELLLLLGPAILMLVEQPLHAATPATADLALQ